MNANRLAPTTQRIYAQRQAEFAAWCRNNGIDTQPTPRQVARFLREGARRGASVPPQQLAAIAWLFRDNGQMLDTRARVIQRALDFAINRPRRS